jgi:GntR family transcriptional regulator
MVIGRWYREAVMIIKISEKSNEPIFMQIVNQIKYLISAGELAKNTRLHSVRELAFSLKVNPNTISKAYKILEMEGVVVTKRGVGVFVSDNLPNSFFNEFKEKVIGKKVKDLVVTAKQLSLKKDFVIKKVENEFNGGNK